MSATHELDPPPLTDRLLSVVDLARLFHANVSTVRRWYREGRLPRPVRVGTRKLLWTPESIARIIHAGEGETPR